MVKIPNNIKKAIMNAAKYNAIATENNNKIRKWLYDNNLYNDSNIDQLIDALETTNVPLKFIEFLESSEFVGNDYKYD